jgi:hypothetical protein
MTEHDVIGGDSQLGLSSRIDLGYEAGGGGAAFSAGGLLRDVLP